MPFCIVKMEMFHNLLIYNIRIFLLTFSSREIFLNTLFKMMNNEIRMKNGGVQICLCQLY